MASTGEVGPRAGSSPDTGQITTEQTAAGEQTVIPGTEKISDAELAQIKADKPLKAKAAQAEPGGLFSDDSKQTHLVEEAKARNLLHLGQIPCLT